MKLDDIKLLNEGSLIVKMIKPSEKTKAGIIKSKIMLDSEHKSEFEGYQVLKKTDDVTDIQVGEWVLLEMFEAGFQFVVNDLDPIVIDGKMCANVMLISRIHIFATVKKEEEIDNFDEI